MNSDLIFRILVSIDDHVLAIHALFFVIHDEPVLQREGAMPRRAGYCFRHGGEPLQRVARLEAEEAPGNDK